MCPGIKDFDEILEDVRMQPATVKEELWPWRLVGVKSCKLWHKPREFDIKIRNKNALNKLLQ